MWNATETERPYLHTAVADMASIYTGNTTESITSWSSVVCIATRLGAIKNHSPPSSAEVKNEWSYTSTPPIWLCDMDRNNFMFLQSNYLNLFGVLC